MIFSGLRKKISDRFHKSTKLFSLSAFSVAAIFLLGVILIIIPHSAQAGIVETLGEGLAWIILRVVSLLGKLLVLIINLFINIAQYNNFINSVPVSVGWSIVRDVCNMFFIVALLVIAFGTILKIERYRYNRLLVNLIIMAILINFSKVIAGFFIDFGQVVMMTFVNAFKDAAAGNFTQAFRMREILELRDDIPEINTADFLGAAVLALAMVLIALVVMIALLVVILVRIIMLWILVVLSPLAYLLSALPGSWQQQSSKWWSNFGKWVAIGPVLAFFVWLSLTVIGDPSGTKDFITTTKDEVSASGQLVETVGNDRLSAAITKASSTDNMLGFALGISMLIMALLTAQQMGGIAGNFAGKALNKIQSGAMAVTGARWVQDRWRAFQGMREQKRKEKAARFGARAYGIYEGAKSIPGAAFKAAGKGIDYVAEKAGKKIAGDGTSRFRKGAGWVAEKAIKVGARSLVVGGAGALTGGAGFGLALGGVATPLALTTAKMMREGSKGVSDFTKKLEKGFMNRVAASMTEKGDFVDSNGKAVDSSVRGHYAYDNRAGAYLKDTTMARFKNLDLQGVSYDDTEKKWQAHVKRSDGSIEKIHLGNDELLTKDGSLVDKYGKIEDVDNPDLKYKYDQEAMTYYRVNDRGEAVDKDGRIAQKLEDRVYAGGKRLPKFVQELGYGWALGRTQSWALRARGEQERISKSSQEMIAAGISPELMHRGLNDNNLSNDARLARGLALAARDGFKGMDVSMARADVELIKKLTASNTLLAKEFQENMYKRFAHLYHDLSTETGRGQLKKAAAEGRVDLTRQDDSSLTPDFLKVMRDHFGKKYLSKLEDAASTDDREKKIISSLKSLVNELGNQVRDEKGDKRILPDRLALANISGDLPTALGRVIKDKDTGEERMNPEYSNNVADFIKNAKVEHIIKINPDLIDIDENGLINNEAIKRLIDKYNLQGDEQAKIDQAKALINATIEGFKAIDKNQINSVLRSREATQRLKVLIDRVYKKTHANEQDNVDKQNDGDQDEEEDKGSAIK